MDGAKVIYNILSNDSKVTNAVGSKIYPTKAKQGVSYPYIVYKPVSNAPMQAKGVTAPVDMPSVQIDVFDRDFNNAVSIAGDIRSALENKSGTYNGVEVGDIFFDNRVALFNEDQDIHQIASDFTIFIKN